MLKRRFLFLASIGLVAASVPVRAADPPATAPTLIIRVRSIDSVIADVKYLTGIAGRGDEARQLDATLKKVLPNGFQGIDSKRPFGLYASLDADGNVQDSKGVVLLPVNDEKTFLGMLEKFNLKPIKDDEGVYTISPENAPVTVYLRFAHNYAYASAMHRSAIEKDKLIPPSKLFSENYPELASVSFRIDQIPDTIRQLIIGQAEGRLASVEDQTPAGETKAQHEFKVQAVKEFASRFTSLIKDGTELSLRLDVDRQAGALTAELGVTGKPNSGLETSFKALGSAESLFAGMVNADSALNLVLHGALPDNLRKVLGPMVDEGIRTGLAKEKDKAKRAQGEKLFKVLAPSLKSGELDAAVSLRGPSANKHYTLVAGLKLKEGSDVDSVLREMLKDLPDEVKNAVSLDAESAGDVKIHRLNVQQAYDEDARKAFGDNPLYIALRSDALFVAGGEGGLSALKEAITARPDIVPPLELGISMARLVPLMGKKHKGDPAAAARMAFADAKDKDKLHITVEGGKTLKARLKIDAAVLKFFSLVDKKGSTD